MPPPSLISSRTGAGAARGTCGELAQGVLPDGQQFHVTCPIELGSEVRITLRPAPVTTITGLPSAAQKTARAIALGAELLELGTVAIEACLTTELPPAKGMASSTADVVAAVRALAAASGQEVDAATLATLATSIESSDGVMYGGVAAIDHHSGVLVRRWDWMPRYTVAVFIPALSRVTAEVGFPRQARLAPTYQALLDEIDVAMTRHDPSAVAHASSMSAELNEAFVENPLLPLIRPAVSGSGALGLCVGHSGTVCGLLFDDDHPDAHLLALAAIEALLPTLPPGTSARVTRTLP